MLWQLLWGGQGLEEQGSSTSQPSFTLTLRASFMFSVAMLVAVSPILTPCVSERRTQSQSLRAGGPPKSEPGVPCCKSEARMQALLPLPRCGPQDGVQAIWGEDGIIPCSDNSVVRVTEEAGSRTAAGDGGQGGSWEKQGAVQRVSGVEAPCKAPWGQITEVREHRGRREGLLPAVGAWGQADVSGASLYNGSLGLLLAHLV